MTEMKNELTYNLNTSKRGTVELEKDLGNLSLDSGHQQKDDVADKHARAELIRETNQLRALYQAQQVLCRQMLEKVESLRVNQKIEDVIADGDSSALIGVFNQETGIIEQDIAGIRSTSGSRALAGVAKNYVFSSHSRGWSN
ncbi:hypothetical protein BBP40_002972 [Aspergillus hancockii]|nr:hypothetical protein BBP40_002972 [Aspergillus hancockii]